MGNLKIMKRGFGSRKGAVYSYEGLKGVSKKYNKYTSSIGVNNRTIYLGLFNTAQEAHEAYVKASKKSFGDTHNDGFNHTMHHLEYEEIEPTPTLEESAPIEETDPV